MVWIGEKKCQVRTIRRVYFRWSSWKSLRVRRLTSLIRCSLQTDPSARHAAGGEQPQGRSQSRTRHRQRSYSDHDTQKCGVAALIRTILLTALLVRTFVFSFLNLLRGLVPAVTLFSSFIYVFGCFSVNCFSRC